MNTLFYRISSVGPLSDKRLLVYFMDNIVKRYDMKPLLATMPAFHPLEEAALFNQVRVDTGGYGIVWNDEVDLSSNELWENGAS